MFFKVESYKIVVNDKMNTNKVMTTNDSNAKLHNKCCLKVSDSIY